MNAAKKSAKKAWRKAAKKVAVQSPSSMHASDHERVLIVEAHADDCAFFMGGTAARMVLMGKQVRVLTVTTGDQSSLDGKLSEADLIARQNVEHATAMSALGITDQQTLGYTNHFLRVGDTQLQLRKVLTREIRKFQPTTICSFDPYNLYEENPDHPLVGRMAWEAAAFAAYPNFHSEMVREEGLSPAYVRRVLMFTPREPNFFVDIAGEPIQRKITAGMAYPTQLALMSDELKYRGGSLGRGLTTQKSEEAWKAVCNSEARDEGEIANRYYELHPAENPGQSLHLAEGFHLVFLGILEKLHSFFVPELTKL